MKKLLLSSAVFVSSIFATSDFSETNETSFEIQAQEVVACEVSPETQEWINKSIERLSSIEGYIPLVKSLCDIYKHFSESEKTAIHDLFYSNLSKDIGQNVLKLEDLVRILSVINSQEEYEAFSKKIVRCSKSDSFSKIKDVVNVVVSEKVRSLLEQIESMPGVNALEINISQIILNMNEKKIKISTRGHSSDLGQVLFEKMYDTDDSTLSVFGTFTDVNGNQKEIYSQTYKIEDFNFPEEKVIEELKQRIEFFKKMKEELNSEPKE